MQKEVTYRLKGDATDFTRTIARAESTLKDSFKKLKDSAKDSEKELNQSYKAFASATAGSQKQLSRNYRYFAKSATSSQQVVSRSFKQMSQSSRQGARGVAKDYNAIGKAAAGAQFKVKSLVTTIGGLALGGGGLTAIATQAAAAADEIAKTSRRLGVATDELQRYQFAAELSGVTTNEFDTAFQRFGRRIGEAAQGFGEARPALKSLNIGLKNLDGTLRPVNQVFDEAIIKLSQIETATTRNALAAKLFDSEGVKLVQIGSQIVDLKNQADAAGVIISEEDLNNIEGFNDAMTIFSKQLRKAVTVALAQMAPTIEKAASVLGIVADNFDEIVYALGAFAKLLVAIKLGAFIQALGGVAIGSLAAARSVNALRVAIQGLKAATFVGLGLIALEIAIQKFLGTIDDTADEIEGSMDKANSAVEKMGRKTVDVYEDVSSEIIQKRNHYNDNIDKLVKAEIKSLEDGLKAQESVVKKQKGLLDDAIKDAKKAAKEFKDAFTQIRSGNQQDDDLNLIDFSTEITKARRLLDQGDNEGAIEAAIKAKDVVLALHETGKYTESQLAGTLKKAQEVQQAASGAIVDQQKTAVEQAETTLQKIQSQINLIKSINFTFDETKSLEEAQRVMDQIKSLIEKQPIVVPVELKPTNGIDANSASAPGYATGGLIRGPGTGTSDSILMWGSNGEYMIRAAAVKKYGLDFLNSLNAGRIPAFANGGLVQAPRSGSTGTPVNLNLGGHSYPMTASPDVAAQLRRETHMEQLKKGRK